MKSVYNPSLTRIYVLIFLYSLSISVTFIAIPVFAYTLKASQLEIGLLGAIYTGIQIPLSIYFGKLSDKVGRIKLLTLSLICGSLAMIFLTLNSNLLLLFLIRALGGFAAAIFWPVSGALSADKAPEDKMVKVMGLSSVAWGISSIIGPTIGGFLIDYFQNFTMTFFVGAVISLATFPILLSLSRLDNKDLNDSQQYRPSEVKAPISGKEKVVLTWSLIAIAFYGLTSGVTWTMFPVYSVILGFSKTVTGLFSTISSIMNVVMFFAVGRLSEKFSKLALCVWGVALCICVILIALFRDFSSLAFSIVMFGLGTGVIYPTARAAVLELSTTKRGFFVGIYESMTTTGMSSGAFLGGAMANYISLESPYYFSSITAVVVASVLILMLKRDEKKRPGD